MRIDALCTIGKDREYDLDEKSLLKEMDNCQVEKAIITVVDRYYAVKNCEGNNAIFDITARYPDRLLPACTANPWMGNDAIKEILRCIELHAQMVIFHPFLQGFLANDELIFPLLEQIQPFHIPVYFHTGLPGNSTPWQIVDLAERFPEIDFLMGHCGSTDFWNDVDDAALTAPNIYLETSLARPFSIPGRIKVIGKERVIMGSYAPVNNFTVEWNEMANVLSADEAEFVMGGNISRLLSRRQ
ncbi:MAG: amidohydrolase family protein [Candidatus Cloacimonetes bacterium]|nr:amidohydrolase family protein [Candidatus Cloacimonadota bacterium]